ncbi:peptidylprolyl isomerase [Caminicella sporogenes]|uniref:peptidylprolyl isomerase n=1 Tax=Caminicella sporogenes TaxID=166485 RepID=UPI002541C881|nr:peptidylprolyl isomerase [Caminicella sporogenes]WIF95383.1 peptidylprolyl isomerase [Caminicella sporogenes]
MDKNKVLATVNGKAITEGYVNEVLEGMGPQKAMQFNSEHGKRLLLNDLINEELFYLGAKESGYENDKEFQEQLEQMKANLLKQYALKKLLEDVEVTEEELLDYYNQNKNYFKTPESVRASHILVDTEEKANDILEELNKGLSFESAAEKYSKCPSKTNGGDLGYFTRGRMVPEFEKASFEMEKGEISKPVKTQFGYHIIKLIDKKEESISKFEDVKNRLKEQLLMNKQRQVYLNRVNELKKKYEVVINE